MMHSIQSLNYLAVLTVTVTGFMLGWLWHSPLLFAKAWMTELKITEEMMKATAEKGMSRFLLGGFFFTFVGTFGLAVLINAHRSAGWLPGAMFGAFVGVFVIGTRILNCGVWEQRSVRLLAINVGHEVVLFTLQGAILGVWR